MTESKILQLIAMLMFGIMVPVSPSGFTPVHLSILCLDPPLQTSVTLLKLLRGGSSQLLYPRKLAWLEWTMVSGIVGLF